MFMNVFSKTHKMNVKKPVGEGTMKPHMAAAGGLALVLLLSSLAGCTESPPEPTLTTTPEPTPTPNPRYTWYEGTAKPEGVDLWETPVGQKILEITGIPIDMEYAAGDPAAYVQTMIAAGNYPDFLSARKQQKLMMDSGAYVDLGPYIEKGGYNIRKTYSNVERQAMQTDGKTFAIPTDRIPATADYPTAGFYLNAEVVGQALYPDLNTLGHFSNIMHQYMASQPTWKDQPVIGFTMPGLANREKVLLYAGGAFLSGYPADQGALLVDQELKTVRPALASPENKLFYQFLNDLWTAGILDKDFLTQDEAAYQQKVASGRVLGLLDFRADIQQSLDALEANGLDSRMPIAFPVRLDGTVKEGYQGAQVPVDQSGVGISTRCADTQGAFNLLDVLAGEDIQKLNAWGIEGVDYSLQAGKADRTKEQWAKVLDAKYDNSQGISRFDLFPRRGQSNDAQYGKFTDGNWVNLKLNEGSEVYRYTASEQTILKGYKIMNLTDTFTPPYKQSVDLQALIEKQIQPQSQEAQAMNTVLALCREYSTKLVQADPINFNKTWDEYIGKVDQVAGFADYQIKVQQLLTSNSD